MLYVNKYLHTINSINQITQLYADQKHNLLYNNGGSQLYQYTTKNKYTHNNYVHVDYCFQSSCHYLHPVRSNFILFKNMYIKRIMLHYYIMRLSLKKVYKIKMLNAKKRYI